MLNLKPFHLCMPEMVLCVFIQKIAKNGTQREFSLIFFFMVFWLKKITLLKYYSISS